MTTDPREYKNDPFDPRPIEEKEREWNRDLDRRMSESKPHKMTKKEREMNELILDMFTNGMFYIPEL